MPTYDYECDACGHEMELFQGINEPVKKKCPECGKRKLRRLFGSGAAIVFKGSGFYQTDYRSEGYKKAAKADEPKSKDSGSKKSGSSDSKASGGESKSASKSESSSSKSPNNKSPNNKSSNNKSSGKGD